MELGRVEFFLDVSKFFSTTKIEDVERKFRHIPKKLDVSNYHMNTLILFIWFFLHSCPTCSDSLAALLDAQLLKASMMLMIFISILL